MDLQTIAEHSPKILEETAIFTAVVYPIYAGVRSVNRGETLREALTKAETFYMTAGMGIGKLLLDYGYLLLK